MLAASGGLVPPLIVVDGGTFFYFAVSFGTWPPGEGGVTATAVFARRGVDAFSVDFQDLERELDRG